MRARDECTVRTPSMSTVGLYVKESTPIVALENDLLKVSSQTSLTDTAS